MNNNKIEEINMDLTYLLDLIRQGQGYPKAYFLESAEWRKLVQRASKLGLAPILYQRLVIENVSSDLPGDVTQFLKNSYYHSLGQNMINFYELHKILLAFQALNISTLLLKGCYLANFVYPNSALRPMVDLDIMVHRRDVERSLIVLKELGFSGSNFPISEEYLDAYHHASPLSNKGVKLELHWALANRGNEMRVDEESLWLHSLPIVLDGAPARALSTIHLVLHICGHAAYSHNFYSLARTLVDVTEILNREAITINWELLVVEANRWRVERGLFLILYLAHIKLGANVPDEILEELMPPDFDPVMIRDLYHILGGDARLYTKGVIQFKNSLTLSGKIKSLLESFFTPSVEIEKRFSVPPNSWKIYLYYPVLWQQKISRHWKTIFNEKSPENKVNRDLRAFYKVQNWLKSPGSIKRQ